MTVSKDRVLAAIDEAFIDKIKDKYRALALHIDSDDATVERDFEYFARGLKNLIIAHERALVIAAKVFGALALAFFLRCDADVERGLASPQQSLGFPAFAEAKLRLRAGRAQAGFASVYGRGSGPRTANCKRRTA